MAPQAAVRLFFFPFAGGGSVAYRPWAAQLPSTIQASFVQLPGRENRLREPAFTTMEGLLDPLLAALAPALDRPYAFFGHSLGAVIAYEAARRLEVAGRGPARLFISGRRAPGMPRRTPAIHQLPAPLLIEALGRLNGIPATILADREMMDMLVPLFRADFTLSDTYQPQAGARLRAPITAFGGHSDPEVAMEGVAAWGSVTDGAFRMTMYDGDHFFITPHRAAILAQVIAELLPQQASAMA